MEVSKATVIDPSLAISHPGTSAVTTSTSSNERLKTPEPMTISFPYWFQNQLCHRLTKPQQPQLYL